MLQQCCRAGNGVPAGAWQQAPGSLCPTGKLQVSPGYAPELWATTRDQKCLHWAEAALSQMSLCGDGSGSQHLLQNSHAF